MTAPLARIRARRQEVRAGGQDLTELDECGAELFQRYAEMFGSCVRLLTAGMTK